MNARETIQRHYSGQSTKLNAFSKSLNKEIERIEIKYIPMGSIMCKLPIMTILGLQNRHIRITTNMFEDSPFLNRVSPALH